MQALKIIGGRALEGSVKVSGAKNGMTKLLIASLLSDKRCIFHNVPNVGDVEITVELCRMLGSQIEWDRSAQTLIIQTQELKSTYIPQLYSGSNRIPILLLGALLGRTDQDIIVPTVGGCSLGMRPVDFHIRSLRMMGAEIEYRQMRKEGAYLARTANGLKGCLIQLPYPSVGATENVILASVRAKGVTLIRNAAIEPEIVDLILFLQKLGSNIALEADRTIRVQETRHFFEVEHRVIFDRNVAASLAMAALATKGRVMLENVEHYHLMAFLNKIREIGGDFVVKPQGIEFSANRDLFNGQHVETDVHPGFMTDWQQPFLVLMTQGRGTSVIHETVYEKRFGYVATLQEMGADITLFKQCLGSKNCRFSEHNHYHSAVVRGPTPLQGKAIDIPDLRAGFAYIMAALAAQGQSTINGLPFLTRGYENLVDTLSSLGADIELCSDEQNKEADGSKKCLEQELLSPASRS